MADKQVRVRFTAKDDTGPAVSRMEKAFGGLKRLAAGVGAAFAAIGIARFFGRAVEAAAEAEAVWTRLEASVTKAGRAFKAVRPELEKAGAAFQRSTRFDDEAFADSMATILGLTNDYTQSLAAVPVAADFAIKHSMDLASASQLVGKALAGNLQSLQRYEVGLDSAGNVLAQLAERTRGYAAKDGQTFQARLLQIKAALGNVMEAFGGAILGADGMTEGTSSVVRVLERLQAWIEGNRATIRGAVTEVLNLARAVGELVAKALGLLERGDQISRFLNTLADPKKTAQGIARLAKGGDFSAPKADFSGVTGGHGSETLVLPDITVTGSGGRGRGTGTGTGKARAPEAPLVPGPVSLTQGPGVRTGGIEGVGAPIEEALTGLTDQAIWEQVLTPWDTLLTKLDDVGGELAYLSSTGLVQFADAWLAATEAMGQGGNVAAEMGKAFQGVLAGTARKKAQMEMAEALADLAAGTWPPNPAALAAAAKHVLAAGAFSALAGGISGLGGSRGGGAGGGAVSGDAALRDQRDLQGARGSTTVIIKGGAFIDPRSPDFQDFIRDTVNNGAGRRLEFRFE